MANNSFFSSPVTAVGQVLFGSSGCSGSLLSTGLHFLTAAHCVGSFSGTATINLHNGVSNFSYTSSRIAVHPNYTNINSGNDIALVTLSQVADPSLQRLSLYTGSGELGQTATIIGLGRQGIGSVGWNTGSFVTANGLLVRRQGTNVVDSTSGNILSFDFDDPNNPARSSSGSNIATQFEAMTSFGDSGGAVLINGLLAGVHSFISCLPGTTSTCATSVDIAGVLNSSYGERFGSTRVSAYTAWLSTQMGVASFESNAVPEPSTWATMLGALAIGFHRWRKTRSGSSN